MVGMDSGMTEHTKDGRGQAVTDSDQKAHDLPWVHQDHERIRGLLADIHCVLNREAMSFVVHRMLEELRNLCRSHFARQRRALGRAGVGEEQIGDGERFLKRLQDFQRQACLSRKVDYAALQDLLVCWQTPHFSSCEKTLRDAVVNASDATRWDLFHAEAARHGGANPSAPYDPKTSGAFLL